jgi:hypothetical protein
MAQLAEMTRKKVITNFLSVFLAVGSSINSFYLRAEEPELDPRLAFEEKDITPLIPSEFHTLIASSKWKERKETLDELHEVISKTPRIKDSEAVSEVMKALAKRMGDANIMCVMTAANCMEGLAKGIGSGFGKYRSVAVPPMLERFKERKQNVVDAIGVALDALFATVRPSSQHYFYFLRPNLSSFTDHIPGYYGRHPHRIKIQEPPSERRNG